jgi:hypothetical protein
MTKERKEMPGIDTQKSMDNIVVVLTNVAFQNAVLDNMHCQYHIE